MNWEPYRKIAYQGLWKNNQALVAMLGLCPLLAVSNSVVNSLGLGLATTFALIFSNGVVALIRHWVSNEVRLPVFVLVIASNVTVIELLMNAYFHDLHKILGIFIPLIVTNCAIIGRAEAFASRNTVDRALADGLFMGLGFTLALLVLGALREVVGTGALFAKAEMMFGDGARNWTVQVIHDYGGFLLAVLPPGAFIGLGLIVAANNLLEARSAQAKSSPKPSAFPARIEKPH